MMLCGLLVRWWCTVEFISVGCLLWMRLRLRANLSTGFCALLLSREIQKPERPFVPLHS